jgi:chaperonin GroES
MNMSIKPLRDFIVVQQIKSEATLASGIILSNSAIEKPNEGIVIAIGVGRYLQNGELIKPEVQVGDKILYGKFTGTEVKVEGITYLMMLEADIMGILK